MKLERKRALVARALDVGMGRIRFNPSRLSEVKEAITKQDMRDLLASGAITVLPVLGRKKIERRTRRRGAGKVRMRVVDKKEKYIILTRKFRKYLANLRITGKVSEENYQKLRREIRASAFRDMNHFKEAVSER